MVSWRADPSYVVEPVVNQVNDKMKFLEEKSSQFLSSTRAALGEMANAVNFEMPADNLDGINIESEGIGDNLTMPQMPDNIPQLGTDNNLDAPSITYVSVPEPTQLPQFDFRLEPPLVPNLSDLAPPSLVPPQPINLDHLPIPAAPDTIDLPVLDDVGLDLVTAPMPANVPQFSGTIDAPNFTPDLQSVEPQLAPIPDLPQFTLPQAPQAPQPQGLDFRQENFTLSEPAQLDTNGFNENEPTMQQFVLPTAPQLSNDYHLPTKPEIDFKIDDVQAPDLDFGEFPQVLQLELKEYEYKELEKFDEEPPELDKVQEAIAAYESGITKDLDKLLQTQEGGYQEQFKEEAKVFQNQYDRIKKWTNGEGTPWSEIYQKIEKLLYNAAEDRENRATTRAVQQVRDDWSSRGFTAPQGALDKRMDAIREEGRMRVAEANRTISVDSFNKQVDEVRFLIEKGLQLEEILYKRYLDQRDYEFAVFKYRMEAFWNIYNAVVQMYNAENEAFKLYFEVYKLQVEHQFKELDHYKVYLESKKMEQEVSRQELEVYQTKLQTINTQVEVYNSQLKAVAQRNDTLKSKIELYRAEVDAVSTEIDFDKLRLGMYQTEVDANKTILSVNDQLIQNYTNRISAYAQKNEILIRNQAANIDHEKLRLDKYHADLAQEKHRIDYQLAEAQNATTHFMQSVEMYKLGVQNRLAEVDYSSKKADLVSRTNIANIELSGKYADINSRIALANVDAQSKVMDTQSKINLANLDAQMRHSELVTRVALGNVEADTKVKEANSRIQGANADLIGKNADIKARIALSNAEMQSKHNDLVARSAMANLDLQSKIALSEADMAGRYAEINSRMQINAAETQLKWSDLITRHAISDMETQFKKTELSTRVALANQDMLVKNTEGNIRIMTSQADLKARFAEMQSRTQISNLQMQGQYIDMVARTNISTLDSQTRIAETNARMAIARADLMMKKYDFNMNKGLEKSKLALEAAKAIGTVNAQLAAGAMSALHVSASMSASGSVGLSSSTSESESKSESHNYNY